MDAKTIIDKLGLSPLEFEGGYFVETYRADESIARSALHSRYSGDRSHSTAIYFLLTPDAFSAMHRVASDEIFHFYTGDPVEMLLLYPDGSSTEITVGPDIMAGQTPQVVVPRGVWQGCRLASGGDFALMGTTVSPGFTIEDFELGNREELIAAYPAAAEMIRSLTKE